MAEEIVNKSDRSTILSEVKFKEQRKTKPSFTSQQFITLFAGSGVDAQPFTMHKEFACHYSPVLFAAFNSTFLESHTQKYHFEETDTEVIHLLVYWLYTQKLDEVKNTLEITDSTYIYQKLIKLWALGDHLLIPRLQNCTLQELIRLSKEENLVPVGTIKLIYATTSKGSMLREWIIEECAVNLAEGTYYECSEFFTYEMLLDIAEWHSRRIKCQILFESSKYMIPED